MQACNLHELIHKRSVGVEGDEGHFNALVVLVATSPCQRHTEQSRTLINDHDATIVEA